MWYCEVSKLKLWHWEGVEDDRLKIRYDTKNIDNTVEGKLAERLKICYVEGKKKRRGRNSKQLVPILFTEETVRAIRFLIKKRCLVGVTAANEYVFASGEAYLIGWDVLQATAKHIEGLVAPKLLTPTCARKMYSTMCQVLDMNGAELT